MCPLSPSRGSGKDGGATGGRALIRNSDQTSEGQRKKSSGKRGGRVAPVRRAAAAEQPRPRRTTTAAMVVAAARHARSRESRSKGGGGWAPSRCRLRDLRRRRCRLRPPTFPRGVLPSPAQQSRTAALTRRSVRSLSALPLPPSVHPSVRSSVRPTFMDVAAGKRSKRRGRKKRRTRR